MSSMLYSCSSSWITDYEFLLDDREIVKILLHEAWVVEWAVDWVISLVGYGICTHILDYMSYGVLS